MNTRLRALILTSVVFSLLFAFPAAAHVRVSDGPLPDGDARPVIHSAVLQAPRASDPLLSARLDIDASDNDAIARYEYRWNNATLGTRHHTDARRPAVDYSSILPNARYALEIRAIDIHSNASDWFPVWSGKTPSAPHVIVAGDSIASGYNRDWFTGDAVCRSNSLSYGSTVVSEMARVLPDAWAPRYSNIAWAGAGVVNMLSGGDDSCGVSHASQVSEIKDLTEQETWSIVVITAGINTTNWTDVIVGLTKDTAISISKAGDRKACALALAESWNLDETRATIAMRTREIVRSLRDETNASVFWTGYHDITGTRLAPAWSPVGTECADELDEALFNLHGAIRTGLGPEARWVDIDGSISTQDWAGWPHPNAEGHVTIGRIVAEAVLTHL